MKKVKNKIYFNFIILIVILSCTYRTQSNEQRLDSLSTKNKENKIDANFKTITSKDIASFYYFNNRYGWYEIDTAKFKEKYYFNEQEKKATIKESDFAYFRLKNTYEYYVLDSFKLEKYFYKIIIFQSDGENDTKELQIMLNSYDENQNLIDVILLDHRFTFESEYFREFNIDLNKKSINIKKYEIEHLIYDENSNIIGTKQNPDTMVAIVKYQISKQGNFKKVH